MAQIDIEDIEKIDKDRNTIQEKVSATYSTFEKDNKKYFQLDTYGRTGRKNPGKISQSIQLDKEAASFIVAKLNEYFNL